MQIRPITDLRNTNEISELCHNRKEPVFITKNGYGDLVVMSIETYEKMFENLEIDNAITEYKTVLDNGEEFADAATVLTELRKKHFGKV